DGVGRNPWRTGKGGLTMNTQPMKLQPKPSVLNSLRRQAMNHFVTALSVISTIIVIAPLVAILVYLIYMGASSLNLAFFTHIHAPVGENGGGMANSIVGSGVILSLASLMGIPVGIAAGIYL